MDMVQITRRARRLDLALPALGAELVDEQRLAGQEPSKPAGFIRAFIRMFVSMAAIALASTLQHLAAGNLHRQQREVGTAVHVIRIVADLLFHVHLLLGPKCRNPNVPQSSGLWLIMAASRRHAPLFTAPAASAPVHARTYRDCATAPKPFPDR